MAVDRLNWAGIWAGPEYTSMAATSSGEIRSERKDWARRITRQHRHRLQGLASRGLAPEPASHVGGDDPHPLQLDSQEPGDAALVPEGALGAAPDGDPVPLPVGQ